VSHTDKDKLEAAKFLDNLTSFLSDETSDVENLREGLRAEGVDHQEVTERFHQILSEFAPTWKERAERERKAALEALRTIQDRVRRTRDELVSEIRRIIETLESEGTGVVAGAYYRKFQEATDEDLKSLLEDLEVQLVAVRRKKRATDSDTK
jgi:ElaB/YqjD/DUF883 family membrane-anchored ribosome-binding protein